MKPIIVANWKMNPINIKEAKRLFDSVKNGARKIKKAETIVCPPFVYLSNIQNAKSNIKFGAQDCFFEQKGAFTGEIAAGFLADVGCTYALVGHSERRHLFGETDEDCRRKLRAAP